jgi:hypothetical protein
MKLDWRQGILYVTTIGMEGCWLYAVMALLNMKVVNGRLSVLGILVLFPVAFVVNMLLRRLRMPRAGILSVSWVLWVAGMLLMVKAQLFWGLPVSDWRWLLSIPQSIAGVIYTFRPELLILISTGVIWWLSLRLTYRASSFAAVVGEFQFGLVMLVLIFFITSLLGTSLKNPVPLALTFFLFALLGISVGHALESTSWLSGLYQGHWSGLLVISIGLILILGLLISSVVTPDLLHLFWAAIKWVGGLIWGLIIKVVTFIASLFPALEPTELPTMPSIPPTESTEEFKLWTMPEWLRSGVSFGWSILVLGAILLALWRVSSEIFGWLRQRLTGMAGAEFEPLSGAFKVDFMNLLKRILLRLLGLKLPFRLRGKEGAVLSEVTPVRQIYRQFLRWAATGGYPRHISQTPREYYFALVGLVPEAREDFDLVTQQYVRARYGAWLPTGGELDELSQAWHRIKQTHLRRAAADVAHGKEVS